ncbi:hypothetical protein [Pigmentiphaga daeguensis]|uniref:ProQ/FINO family protein n=1 Tax=Pigmentiphaga daeguensis TaxID=414049 RepID=A0ABN1B8I4_9BURK
MAHFAMPPHLRNALLSALERRFPGCRPGADLNQHTRTEIIRFRSRTVSQHLEIEAFVAGFREGAGAAAAQGPAQHENRDRANFSAAHARRRLAGLFKDGDHE